MGAMTSADITPFSGKGGQLAPSLCSSLICASMLEQSGVEEPPVLPLDPQLFVCCCWSDDVYCWQGSVVAGPVSPELLPQVS
jgi:hypothetical protein